MRHLTVDAVLAIHEEVLAAHGGSTGLRDRALLESAIAAPQASYGGEPLLKDGIE
ncbi:MAG: type II toxin-antitoxin system death-on-curing family toxin, partial [Gammaproteobacteria bacterium]|nr:type II toxin-antitoxin system death-on-curing family toxin [Gammaproteobacteria bacterium]